MARKAKEKNKLKNTKDESLFNLDNEIVVGIKTLPEPEVPKQKKKKKAISKKTSSSNKKKVNNSAKKKNTSRTKKSEEEFELNLGIEDETVKKKKASPKKNKKITKQQEQAIKKRKRIYHIVKWTTLFAIIIGGGIYFMLSPYFNIKTITVTGNSKITSEELISLSNIQLEENTFKIKNSKVIENVKQNAYIDTVKVKRKLPSQIEIQVTERTPTYMLTFANSYIYINNQGYLLEISNQKLNTPIITGFLTPQENLHEGNRLCAEDLQRLDAVLQIMKSAQSNSIEGLVTKINIADKQNYILELASHKKTVHMGDTSNLSTKMLYINSILEENKDIEGEIFVNTDLSKKGAIFRKKV